jgi:hypothetical protein
VDGNLFSSLSDRLFFSLFQERNKTISNWI